MKEKEEEKKLLCIYIIVQNLLKSVRFIQIAINLKITKINNNNNAKS